MKAQCDKCKEIVPLRFRTEDDGIVVDCPDCKQQYVVAGDRDAPRVAPVAVPVPSAKSQGASAAPAEKTKAKPKPKPKPKLPTGDMVCAKCGESQPKSSACRSCGLVPDNWTQEQAAGPPVDAAEDELWAACEADWQSDAPHDALLAYCEQCATYASAAARYGKKLKTTGDNPIASRRLARLLLLAQTVLASSAGNEPMPSKRKATVIAFAVFVVCSGLLYGGCALFGNKKEVPVKTVPAGPGGPVRSMSGPR